MKILIVGGTGFIGQKLCSYFLKNDNQIYVLTRNLKDKNASNNSIHFITELNNDSDNYEVIINLAGEPLNKNRWNDKVKKSIYESRIETTKKIINFIKNSKFKPKTLISGSAIGFYGNQRDQVLTEDSLPNNDSFAHKLCEDWENAAKQASKYGVRVCLTRMGIVLGNGGGALKEMISYFKYGLGNKIGNGSQWMSWIHIDDVVGSVDFLIKNNNLQGAFNLTSPEPVPNKIFSNVLAATLNRPCFLTLPNLMVKIVFGEMGETLLLNSAKVMPQKLISNGYKFKFIQLSDALKNIIKHE